MTTPYRVYIAAASVSSEIDRVERWAAKLKEIGIEVVSTWPQNIRDVGVANPRDATREQRKEWAETCADQVARANALWLMSPPGETPERYGIHTRGAWVELGIAYATGADIVCSGDTKQTIFTALAANEDYDDHVAFAAITQLAVQYVQPMLRADKSKRTKAVRK